MSIFSKSHLYMVAILAISTISFQSCGMVEQVLNVFSDENTKARNTLEDGITRLGVESENWQEIMQETADKMPKKFQSTISNEIQTSIQRGVAVAGIEFRCNIDFLANRMKGELRAIKARFFGGTQSKREPVICQISPTSVDMALEPGRRNKIEFSGYNFDDTRLVVVLIEGNREIDITDKMSIGTHYHKTLNLSANGVRLTERSQAIKLKKGNIDLHTIPVLQKVPEECDVKLKSIIPNSISFIPPHTLGDQEFRGHGPEVECSVTLFTTPSRTAVMATVWMKAQETRNDWSTGEGSKTYTLFSVDPGWKISKIISERKSRFFYIDNNWTIDEFSGSGPVRKYLFMGDGKGNDAGIHTGVQILFSQLRVELTQTEDCAK